MGKRVPSEKQILTARANGQKSRGPVSETSKANSSRNAIRHGVLASAIEISLIENRAAAPTNPNSPPPEPHSPSVPLRQLQSLNELRKKRGIALAA